MARIIASNTVPGSRNASTVHVPTPGKPTPPGVPIYLHDQVTVPPAGEAPMSSKAFLNTRAKALFLRGMSVTIVTVPPAGGVVAAAMFGLAGTVAFQIALTKKNGKTLPITRGYVPAWCFCRSDNRITDAVNQFTAFTMTAQKWRFSSMIVLDPGDMISVQVKHLGSVNLNVTVDVGFHGSDAGPSGRRRLPYTAYWQSRDFLYAEVGGDSTPKDALLNDTGTDLTVDRIIGRFSATDLGGPGSTAEFVDFGGYSDQAANYATLRAGLSQNRTIIRDFLSFRSAFGTNAALETSFVMVPQDQIVVDVRHAAGDVGSLPIGYFRGRAFVSLVGSREI